MSVTKGLIGKEDLQLGLGTFSRLSRTGVPITITEINSGIIPTYRVTKTGAYTPTSADDIIFCDAASGAITITLPALANMIGKVIKFIKTDNSTNKVTLDISGSDTIDWNDTSRIMASRGARLDLYYNGSNWITLEQRGLVY